VSSSGHLILLEGLLGKMVYHIPDLEHVFLNFSGKIFSIDVFFHLLHGPTMIIVALFFSNRWLFLVRHFYRCYHIILKIMVLTAIADVATAVFFVGFKLFPLVSIPLGFGFFITGVLLYSLRWCQQGNGHWDWKKALLLGIVQGCALLPGISRLAAVYVSARWLGLPTRKAFEITWLVQWPLICAAFFHGIYILTLDQKLLAIILKLKLLAVVLIASVCAYILLGFVQYLVNKNQLWWFSLYMPIPVLVWLIFL